MAVVTLNITEFRTMHPNLTSTVISDASLTALWDMAVELVGNSDDTSFFAYNPDTGINKRKWALYAVLCHLATLQVSNPNGVAGRVASASEGSVSTSFDLIQTQSQSAQWWNQTQCGATYWMLSAKYRLGGRLYMGGNHYHPYG